MSEPTVVNPLPLDACEGNPEVVTNQQYGLDLIAMDEQKEFPKKEKPVQDSLRHPAQVFLDEIETASSFDDPAAGQRIRLLVAKVRSTL